MASPTTVIELDGVRRLDDVLAFGKVVRKVEPYPHIVSPGFYTEQFAETLLDWLESEPTWKLKDTIRYAQYEFGFSQFKHCKAIEGLWNGAGLARLRQEVARASGVAVSNRINISAHKSVPGQHAYIHTDEVPEEVYRVIVQLNRGRPDNSGGNLILLAGSKPADMAVVFQQISNSAIGFELGAKSYHAVGRVHSGTRFTIIYTFLSDTAADDKYSYFVAS
jgi:hypothetical protein